MKNHRSLTIILALLSIVVIIEGITIYMGNKEKNVIKEEMTNTKTELDVTLNRLKEIQTELDQKIVEVKKLGGNYADLQKAKNEVDAQLKANKARSAKSIQQLKNKVEGYEQLLVNKDVEIENLKKANKVLFSENVDLKTKSNELSDSINQLSAVKQNLETQVAIASQLKAENIVVKAVNSSGKERTSPFKNRQIEKIRVEFNIAENKIAPIEGKKILIRIFDENNQIIFDIAKGSGTFLLDGKEEFYTASQDILYDNTKQKLLINFEKGSPYTSGKYNVEIYTDSYLMGSSSFVVK